MSKEDLKASFQTWYSELIREAVRDEEYLTPEALAEKINYSVHWIYKESSRQGRTGDSALPPIHRRGRKILFAKSEVDAWLQSTHAEESK